jgi:hypothetical protein
MRPTAVTLAHWHAPTFVKAEPNNAAFNSNSTRPRQ